MFQCRYCAVDHSLLVCKYSKARNLLVDFVCRSFPCVLSRWMSVLSGHEADGLGGNKIGFFSKTHFGAQCSTLYIIYNGSGL